VPRRTADQGRRVPRDKSLRTFDFDANPNVDPAVPTLATGDWVKKGLLLCLIGDSGTGKSHLLIAPDTEAAMKGHRVRYVLAIKLVNELVEAADEKMLAKTIEPVMRNVVAWRWTRDQPGCGDAARKTAWLSGSF
jgi:DNA replication protein DnaC